MGCSSCKGGPDGWAGRASYKGEPYGRCVPLDPDTLPGYLAGMAKHPSSRSQAASSSTRWPLLIGIVGAATAIVATLVVTTFGGASGTPLTTISVHDLDAALQDGDPIVLDVREPWEYEQGHVESARLMPLIRNTAAAAERANLPKDEPVYVICRTGSRSMQASRDLVEAGFTDVRNVAGGITEWAAAGYDVVN